MIRTRTLLSHVMPAVVLALLIMYPPPAAPQQAVMLKLAHAVSVEDPYQHGAEKFRELVQRESKGRITVQVFPAAQLGNEREIIEGVSIGTIEVGLVASAPLAGFSSSFLVFDLPFLFKDAAHARRILDGPVGERVAKTLEPKGIKILAYNESGFRMMINSKKPVRTPDDLKGLKFRVMENPVYVSMFKAFGGSAVPIPFSEVYTSLLTGVVDGAEVPVNVIYTSKWHEKAKNLSLTRHTYTPTPFIMNLKLFNNLSPADQQLLIKAAREAAASQRALIDRRTNEFIELLKKDGVQVSEIDHEAFRSRAVAVYKEFEEKIGKDLLQAVLEAK